MQSSIWTYRLSVQPKAAPISSLQTSLRTSNNFLLSWEAILLRKVVQQGHCDCFVWAAEDQGNCILPCSLYLHPHWSVNVRSAMTIDASML